MCGDEVGDRLGLDFGLAATSGGGRIVGEAVLVVGADVPELVGQSLGGLRWVDVIANPDDARCEVGVAVGAEPTGSALDPEAVVADKACQVFPEPVGTFPRELSRFGVGQWLAVGLGDVEDVDDLNLDLSSGRGVRCGSGSVAVFGADSGVWV